MKNKMIKQLVVNAIFIALLVVSSFISIPIGHIPYTLQTLLVFIIVMFLNYKDSLIIFLIYTVMGLIGLPVFSNFSSGLTPTLGFIIGFITAPIIYVILDKIILIKKEFIKKLINCLIILIIIDLIGSIYYAIYFECNYITSLLTSVVPFILFDILKIIIAIIITKRLNIIKKENF